MHGLFRVRGFTQDDAHIFCLPHQVGLRRACGRACGGPNSSPCHCRCWCCGGIVRPYTLQRVQLGPVHQFGRLGRAEGDAAGTPCRPRLLAVQAAQTNTMWVMAVATYAQLGTTSMASLADRLAGFEPGGSTQ